MQVAICDDERIFIEQLHEMVEKTGRIEKCDLYDNPDSIRAALRKNVAYDIVFMDIDWKREEENGTRRKLTDCIPKQILFLRLPTTNVFRRKYSGKR